MTGSHRSESAVVEKPTHELFFFSSPEQKRLEFFSRSDFLRLITSTWNKAMREEKIKRAIDIAYRARGFDEKLHQEGFIRRGHSVRPGTTANTARRR
jgi:hypothetical protein